MIIFDLICLNFTRFSHFVAKSLAILAFQIVVSFSIFVLIGANAFALPPRYTTEVTSSPDSSFMRPMVKVKLRNNAPVGELSDTETLGSAECSFMGIMATRLCARIVKAIPEKRPGDTGYDARNPANNAPGSYFGNDTGIQGDPRTRMCVYEDPLDGADTDPNHNPYNEHEKNEPFIPVAMAGVVMAASTATVFLAPVGIGLLIASVVLSYHNHVVVGVLGCVDVPLSALPPVWSNDAWHINYLPNPDRAFTADATFFDPKINIRICKDSTVAIGAQDKIIPCSNSGAITKEQFILNASDQHKTIDSSGSPLFEDCRITGSADGRIFCSSIKVNKPNEVCLSKSPVGTTKRVLIQCFARPQYMPRPLIQDAGYTDSQHITISYPTSSGTRGILNLVQDPGLVPNTGLGNLGLTPTLGWTSASGYLQQINFSIYTPCQTPGANGACQTYKNQTCVSGYEDNSHMVVVTTATNVPIPSLPNQTDPALGSLIYSPPPCNQRDDTGHCLNYSGNCADVPLSSAGGCTTLRLHGGECCTPGTSATNSPNCPGIAGPYRDSNGGCIQYVRNVTNDPYYYDSSPINSLCTTNRSQVTDPNDCRPKQTVRPLTPEELGMCITSPRASMNYVKNGGPGTSNITYTVPDGCGKIAVRMWGGGGSGYAEGDGDDHDGAGGSGGYAKVNLRVVSGQVLTLNIAAPTTYGYGSPTSITYNNGSVSYSVQVPGGAGGKLGWWQRPSATPRNNPAIWAGSDGAYCSNTNTSASCYIVKSRDGINGDNSGNGVRGAGGGNSPGWGNTSLIDGSNQYTGCTWGAAVPKRTETSFLPEEDPTWARESWAYGWPGAGGCSWDDPDWEPYGAGGYGRMEIQCIQGYVTGGQANCVAKTQRLKRLNMFTNRYDYYDCTLPATTHGQVAPNAACVLDTSNVPVRTGNIVEILTNPCSYIGMNAGSCSAITPTVSCSNGNWLY